MCTSALEWTHAWLFCYCSLFKNRMMGYSSVIVSINTVARWFQGRVNESTYIALAVCRVQASCRVLYMHIHTYQLAISVSVNHGIARTFASSKRGDLLISAIVFARSFRHILVNRKVFKHWTKVYCISVSINWAQYMAAKGLLPL